MGESGEVVTFRDLDESSNQHAHAFRGAGLKAGDVVAFILGNDMRYFELVWAAQRAGLYFVCVSAKLTASEAAYVIQDSGAKLVIAGLDVSTDLAALRGLVGEVNFELLGGEGTSGGWMARAQSRSVTPIVDERAGTDMLYSSGTTGRPKGIRPLLPADPLIEGYTTVSMVAHRLCGFGTETVYLCPAPLYHAAPMRWSMAVQQLGGTVVLMEKFDPELALKLIERHRVTHSQWVPTHFVRLLRLPEQVRFAYDISSLKMAIHAAAPCPVPVKHQMIEWWGPILLEYYGGSEGNGMTMIDSTTWLGHQGSVGTAVVGSVRICDDDGEPLPVGEEGGIFFENGPGFEYHNDPEKTAAARNARGWTTIGDVGRVDADGFLYLTDRKGFTIISGGVNIYPQEIENILIMHPKILDAAVVGAPDVEMGERVVAVVQPADWGDATPEFAEELFAWLRPQLSGVKMPRQIDFEEQLPRHDTGKLYKRLLRDRYREMAERQNG